jgi:hypothetical protein
MATHVEDIAPVPPGGEFDPVDHPVDRTAELATQRTAERPEDFSAATLGKPRWRDASYAESTTDALMVDRRQTATRDERGLVWRGTPGTDARQGQVRPAHFATESAARVTAAEGPVLLAPGLPVEPDPFEDPFGDRSSQEYGGQGLESHSDRQAPGNRSAVWSDQSRENTPRDVPGVRLSTEDDRADLRLETRAKQASPPLAVYEEPPRRATRPVGAQPAAPEPRGNDVYNERECESETNQCQALRDRLRQRSIEGISLDISPAFNPVTLESGLPPPERSRAFEQQVRSWKDNQGRLVAEGTLQGFHHGRVLIRTLEGKLVKIPLHQLSDLDQCYFAAWWGLPTECTLGYEPYVARSPAPATFTWKAAALHHKPLYFEEVQLERYGHTAGPLLQPALSGLHFLKSTVTLPYQMGIHPPHECQYPLGYYRPGNCAPWLVPPLPVSVRGGAAEAGAVLGAIFVIP